jgi:hypothetical protein
MRQNALFEAFIRSNYSLFSPFMQTHGRHFAKKMIERLDSQFQPNTLFTCTGKVAGFLNHNVRVQPPLLAEDSVVIVVPSTWNFLDKATLRDSISVALLTSTPPKKPSTQSFNKSKFMSPSKPPTPQSATSTPSHSQPIDFTSSC